MICHATASLLRSAEMCGKWTSPFFKIYIVLYSFIWISEINQLELFTGIQSINPSRIALPVNMLRGMQKARWQNSSFSTLFVILFVCKAIIFSHVYQGHLLALYTISKRDAFTRRVHFIRAYHINCSCSLTAVFMCKRHKYALHLCCVAIKKNQLTGTSEILWNFNSLIDSLKCSACADSLLQCSDLPGEQIFHRQGWWDIWEDQLFCKSFLWNASDKASIYCRCTFFWADL